MSQKSSKEQDKELKAIEGALTGSEAFIEKNQKPLLITLAVILLAAIAWLLITNLYINPKEAEAEESIRYAQVLFLGGDYKTALEGDSVSIDGFAYIADEYSITKTGKLANAYAGLCNYHLGNYEEAIDYLSKAELNDDVLKYTVEGTIGDSYVELGDREEAVKHFEKAAKAENILVRPVYLVKAGLCYEAMGDKQKALEKYQAVKDETLPSQSGIPEVDNIDRYIARVQ